jgi:hypothetical protein
MLPVKESSVSKTANENTIREAKESSRLNDG